uniref:Apple domain-containing protein n=1 Tax=Elaeophora elaphi TaxID=1147741 RepID=A0A0R3RQ80_9BILA
MLAYTSIFQIKSTAFSHSLFQPVTSHQSRQIFLLRYISRRKPCKYLLFIQFGILALLIVFFVSITLLLSKSREKFEAMKTEHRIYETYLDSITLAHCHYMFPKNYVELCDRQCGSSAYIALSYENSLGSKTESTCPSLVQTIPCHEKPAKCNQKLKLRQCPGVNGIPLFRNLSITPLTIVKQFPSFFSFFFSLANSLFDRKKRSDQMCYRQLETVREGWPEQYRICDSEVLSEIMHCIPYDT